MNSQFSYELDERQIRILMQSAELNFTEAAWQRFESTEKIVSHSKIVKFVPNINLNFSINRSIVIPIFFVSLIGGMSILLFSFVDFKKKPEVITEKPLVIPEPTVHKTTTAENKTEKLPIKTTVAPIVTTPQKNVAAIPNQTSIDLKTLENKAIEASKKSETTGKLTENKPAETIAAPKTENKTITEADTHQNKTTDKPKKKRKKRMVAEELPTINTAPSSLSQSSEPELDLK